MNELEFKLEDFRIHRLSLVETSGVYSCWFGSECLYVGMAYNLWRRVRERWRWLDGKRVWAMGGSQFLYEGGPWTPAPEGSTIRIWFTMSPRIVEKEKIEEFKPKHNIRGVLKPTWTRRGLTGKCV